MKSFKKRIQDWLGVTNLSIKVVEIDLQLNGKPVEQTSEGIVKGYVKP